VSIAGSALVQVSRVNATVAWPSRSLISFGGHCCSQPRGGVRVTHVVQPDGRQPSRPYMPPKPQAESVRVDGRAGRHGEGQAVVRRVRARGQPFFTLALAMLTQRRHGSRVECDSAPATSRLGLAGHHLLLAGAGASRHRQVPVARGGFRSTESIWARRAPAPPSGPRDWR
jgi:hypothetical protein